MDEMKNLAEELDIQKQVLFMGLQKDTVSLYQAMDLFAMPSVYEGLPLAGIEAQCAGLPCIFTENISRDIEISDQVHFLPIGEENMSKWVHMIKDIRNRGPGRSKLTDAVSRFDIESVSRAMLDRYQQLWEHNE